MLTSEEKERKKKTVVKVAEQLIPPHNGQVLQVPTVPIMVTKPFKTIVVAVIISIISVSIFVPTS